jgi:hypothetical protein
MKREAKTGVKLFLSVMALCPSVALSQTSAAEIEQESLAPPTQETVSQSENEMLLVCTGTTLRSTPTSQTSAMVTDNSGNMAVGSATSSSIQNAQIQVRLRITGEEGELFVPAGFMNSGWRKVKKFKMGADEISGKISYWLTQSSFRIDRRTGIMTTSNGFEGNCIKEDLQQRAF